MSARRLVLLLFSGVSLAGCGGAETTSLHGSGTDEEGVHVGSAAGARIVAVPRRTPGVVHLSLWVDAGARDANPPQLATLAAWHAAARAGLDARARVLPDGTSVTVLCPSSELATCVANLGRALSTRRATDAEVDALRRRLVDARRRADTDELRRADTLALEALLGDGARGLSPLGNSEDDGGTSSDALRAFYDAHYGPTRAMFVGVGEIGAEGLTSAVEDALDDAPNASEPRAGRETSFASEHGARVDVGARNATAAALWVPSFGVAVAAAESVAGGPLAEHRDELTVYAFPVRGGALVLVRLQGPRRHRLFPFLLELARLEVEGVSPVSPRLPDHPAAVAERLGNEWVAVSELEERAWRVGLGLLVDGGRGDGGADDPDRGPRARAVADAERLLGRARRAVAPELRGRVDEAGASITIPNGARIAVERRAGDESVAVAVRFAGGAGADPPDLHGRAALAATVTATTCAGLGAGALATRLDAIGATIEPLSEPDSHGIVATAPRDRWRDALDLAVRCGIRPGRDAPSVARARLRLLDRLRRGPHASWIAASLAPDAPGLVAPWGAAAGVRDVNAEVLAEVHRESVVGARLAVAIVGEVPVRECVERAARRVSHLRAGTVPHPPSAGAIGRDVVSVRFDGESPRAVIGVRAPGDPAAAGTARAFAAALGGALGAERGLRPRWNGGGAGAWGIWAAVAVDAQEDVLDDLPTTVARALRSARSGAEERRSVQQRRDALALGRPGTSAAHLSATLLGTRPEDRFREASARALSEAPPRFAIARPRE